VRDLEFAGVLQRVRIPLPDGRELRKLLFDREDLDRGQPILRRVNRITYEEVAHDLRVHYRTTRSRTLEEADYRLNHLNSAFAGKRLAAIGSAEITAYVSKRQTEGAANATINRELATLSRMLRLAYENGKLLRLPVIRRLKENPPRQGFFEWEQYVAVMRHLPPDLQVAVSIATPSAGAFAARCSSWSGDNLTSVPGRSSSNLAWRRTTRGALYISPPSSRLY
jgi:hypothetical protein